jgi:hypothetical protein
VQPSNDAPQDGKSVRSWATGGALTDAVSRSVFDDLVLVPFARRAMYDSRDLMMDRNQDTVEVLDHRGNCGVSSWQKLGAGVFDRNPGQVDVEPTLGNGDIAFRQRNPEFGQRPSSRIRCEAHD